MVDRGRTVLDGEVVALRAAAGGRQLRVQVDGAARHWHAGLPGVTVVRQEADELRLALAPVVDPLAVLDAARAAGHVMDFGLDLPTLSQLFLAAAGRDVRADEVR